MIKYNRNFLKWLFSLKPKHLSKISFIKPPCSVPSRVLYSFQIFESPPLKQKRHFLNLTFPPICVVYRLVLFTLHTRRLGAAAVAHDRLTCLTLFGFIDKQKPFVECVLIGQIPNHLHEAPLDCPLRLARAYTLGIPLHKGVAFWPGGTGFLVIEES